MKLTKEEAKELLVCIEIYQTLRGHFPLQNLSTILKTKERLKNIIGLSTKNSKKEVLEEEIDPFTSIEDW